MGESRSIEIPTRTELYTFEQYFAPTKLVACRIATSASVNDVHSMIARFFSLIPSTKISNPAPHSPSVIEFQLPNRSGASPVPVPLVNVFGS